MYVACLFAMINARVHTCVGKASKKTHAQFNPLRMGVAGWVASDRELCKASGRQHEKWDGSVPPPQKVGVPKHPLPP